MSIIDKIRIKSKIHKMCKLMRKTMNQEDLQESANVIKNALHELPQERKEGLLDECLKVLKNGSRI